MTGGAVTLLGACLALTAIGAVLAERLLAARDRISETPEEIGLLDRVPQFVWRANAAGQVDFFNNEFRELTGEDPGQAVACNDWRRHIHPDDLAAFEERWSEAVAEKSDVRTLFRILHAHGEYRWMRGYGRPWYDPQTGAVLGWYGALHDVHEEILAKQKAEALIAHLDDAVRTRTRELLQSEERFRTLFDDMNIAYAEQYIGEAKRMIDGLRAAGVTNFRAYIVANPHFVDKCLASIRVNRVNGALLNMMGYRDHDELVAKPPTENAVDSRRVMTQQLEAMFDERHHFMTTATLLGKDNRRITVAVGVNASADWAVSLSTHIDITERLQADEMVMEARGELARVNRALTIGALSSSLAHELNQPLLALGMSAQAAKRWLARTPPDIAQAEATLEKVTYNAERMDAIIRNTRLKLVRGASPLVAIELTDVLAETAMLLEHDVETKRVRLIVVPSPRTFCVKAVRIELQQVLTNIVLNAAEALQHVRDNRIIRISIEPQGSNVAIVIADNGPGIAKEHLSHIFEPFFTTKAGGMGMGLQICRNIVDGFNGTLKAENGPQGGAIFRIELPLTATDEMLAAD